MPRRYDDDDDRDDDDRPRRRRRRDDDYDDDDDDDRPIRRRRPQRSFLDSTFADTSIVILILFGFCCGWIALVLSLVAMLTCTDETAKRNALIVLIISAIAAFAQVGFGVMRAVVR